MPVVGSYTQPNIYIAYRGTCLHIILLIMIIIIHDIKKWYSVDGCVCAEHMHHINNISGIVCAYMTTIQIEEKNNNNYYYFLNRRADEEKKKKLQYSVRMCWLGTGKSLQSLSFYASSHTT